MGLPHDSGNLQIIFFCVTNPRSQFWSMFYGLFFWLPITSGDGMRCSVGHKLWMINSHLQWSIGVPWYMILPHHAICTIDLTQSPLDHICYGQNMVMGCGPPTVSRDALPCASKSMWIDWWPPSSNLCTLLTMAHLEICVASKEIPIDSTRFHYQLPVHWSGWWFQPLWKMLVNGKDYPIYYEK